MKIITLLALTLLSSTFLKGEEVKGKFSPERKFSNPDKSATFEATIKKYDGSKATLIRKGQSAPITIDIIKLSEEDKAWLDEHKETINGTPSEGAPENDASQDKSNKFGEELKGITNKLEIKNAKEFKFVESSDTKLNADYYIVVYSASWCGPCREEMPDVVRFARSIAKNPKVELILASGDKDVEEALKWAKDEKMPFPIIFSKDKDKSPTILGASPKFIPRAALIDGKTNKVICVERPTDTIKAFKKLKK